MNIEPVKLNQKDRAKLRRIRGMVEKTHWFKGNYHDVDEDGKEKYCLVGFVNLVTNNDAHLGSHRFTGDQRSKLIHALEWAIKQVKPRSRQTYIETFNDLRATKREDILAVLDTALGSD